MTRRTWPPRPDDTRPISPVRTPVRPRPPRRVTAERRAEKRRESLAMAIACMALLVAVWALLIAASARDALMIVGAS